MIILWSVGVHETLYTGYPLHRENRKNGPKKSPSAKTQGNLKILPKTQGISFA